MVVVAVVVMAAVIKMQTTDIMRKTMKTTLQMVAMTLMVMELVDNILVIVNLSLWHAEILFLSWSCVL